MDAKKQLTKALQNRFSQKQDAMTRQPAVMGNGNGVLHPAGLNGFVYCTVGDKAVPVFNNRVPSKLGMKVWVGYAPEEPTLFQVLSTRSDKPIEGDTISLGYAPAKRYEWNAVGGGQDPLHVHLRAISMLKLGVSSAGGMNAEVYRGYIWTGSGYLSVATQDIDLTSQQPTAADTAALVLITIDTSGSIVQTKGAEVNIYALALSDLPTVPSDTAFVCGAVRVYTGQTEIQDGRANTDFVDLRFSAANQFAASGADNPQFAIDGALALATNCAAAIVITQDVTISQWYIYAKTTGSASSTIADINLAGVTIFSTQANRPTLAYNDPDNIAISGTPSTTQFSAGDVLTIDLDQVATGAADLVVIGVVDSTGAATPYFPAVPVVNIPGSSITTTSASYTDFTASYDLSLTKLLDETDVLITLHGSIRANTSATVAAFAVYNGSTDYEILQYQSLAGSTNTHFGISGQIRITGLAAGTQTFRLRWYRVSGSGTLTYETTDFMHLSAQEVT